MSAARSNASGLPTEPPHEKRPENGEPERRADALLAVARRLLRDEGLAALNMARIAEAAGCSRPAG